MRILLAEPDPLARARMADRLGGTHGYRLIAAVDDLSATYTVAEHRVPNIALVSTTLAAHPEFEVLCLLFRALSIRCVLFSNQDSASGRDRELADRAGLALVSSTDPVSTITSQRSASRRNSTATTDRVIPGKAGEFDDGWILIGASTGGVDALIRVLSSFPQDCPPTMIVQHTGAKFTAGLAQLVDGHVTPEVREAAIGLRPAQGQILIAPGGDQHLVLKRFPEPSCGFEASAPCQGHRPSVDRLFLSAVPGARRVAAAILTGMGRDGADGLLALRRAGAMTIGQDEKTSVVFGMPRAAHEIGAVSKQLPLDAIGPALLRARMRRT
ncbi:MAG: chemotaxis protein CheB [Rhodobiaceae bacterium]|jgi:two-component system chemotaxis response regulator CheB|nr:chemotaxis protein CheB [Rhodobiaceae bacterium]